MKNIYVLLAALLVLAAGFAALPAAVSVAHAQAVEYPVELQYYDAQIDLMLPRLEAFQAQYYAVNARFYQALESHTAAPDVPEVPDNIDASPTDQPEDLALFWESFAGLPDVLAWSFRIDAYSGPDGDGYVVTISTVVNGETWQRSVNYGPETWRAADWYLVTAPPL